MAHLVATNVDNVQLGGHVAVMLPDHRTEEIRDAIRVLCGQISDGLLDVFISAHEMASDQLLGADEREAMGIAAGILLEEKLRRQRESQETREA